MQKRKKFKPSVKKISLNPEQAVLYCACYGSAINRRDGGMMGGSPGQICAGRSLSFSNRAIPGVASS